MKKDLRFLLLIPLALLLLGATSAEIYIRNLATTATTPASDDYMAVDGATKKTRKIRPWYVGNKVAAAMAANEIDTSGRVTNTKTLTGTTVTFTYSETPPDGTVVVLNLTGHTAACTVTIPSTYSLLRKTTVTSFVMPANGYEEISLKYSGSTWYMAGEPSLLTITEPAAATTFTPASGSNTTFAGAYTISHTFPANATVTWPSGTFTLATVGGNLGTPSAITLTNGTGLPIAGLTNSTTQGLGLGSVELGHASDTTLARSAAGTVTIEGVTIPAIAPGTTGNVMTSNGTAWTSAAPTGGGAMATDTLWDAAGDLAVGTGANTGARLAIGRVGSILSSTGSTAEWQTLANTIEFKEEFFWAKGSSDNGPWDGAGTIAAANFEYGDANHWGVIRFRNTTVATFYLMAGFSSIRLGAATGYFEWIIKTTSAVSDGTNDYTLFIGLAQDGLTDGVGFLYNHATNGGEWQGKTISNTTASTLDTNVAYTVDTWVRLGVLVTNASNAEFFINGSSVGSITTNIPNGAGRVVGPYWYMNRTAGTAERDFFLDAFQLVFKPSTPR